MTDTWCEGSDQVRVLGMNRFEFPCKDTIGWILLSPGHSTSHSLPMEHVLLIVHVHVSWSMDPLGSTLDRRVDEVRWMQPDLTG